MIFNFLRRDKGRQLVGNYDGPSVIEEQNSSQNLVREYVNGGQYIDEVILVVNGSSYNYYMSDLRYCVYGFVNSSGAVVERARYDGYGKRTLCDNTYATITTPVVNQYYGYTGIKHDSESGLQYYRARYFDNYLGRFINRDPIGYIDGFNLYRGYFVNGGVDPSGKSWEDILDYFAGCGDCLPRPGEKKSLLRSSLVSSGFNRYTGTVPGSVDQVLTYIQLIDNINSAASLATAAKAGTTEFLTEVATQDVNNLAGISVANLIAGFNKLADAISSRTGYTYIVVVKDTFCVECRGCADKGKYENNERTFECKPSDLGLTHDALDRFGVLYQTPGNITTSQIEKCHKAALAATH